MDPILELEARRLFASTALTTHALRCLRGRIALGSGASDLLTLAHRLREGTEPVERRYGLRFEPAYPGVTVGPEVVGDSLRLVLACAVFIGETPLGVAFTALISGRPPQVSVAPVEARIPEGWRPLDDLP